MTDKLIRPYLDISPNRTTSARGAVFSIALPQGAEWPEGVKITHKLDGVKQVFDVPAGNERARANQGAVPVYFSYPDLEVGEHEWSAELSGPGLHDTTFGPYEWAVVEPQEQAALEQDVILEPDIEDFGKK